SHDCLKAIWSAQEWGGDPMTATELANRFGTAKANVTEVLKRLDELELIKRVPYRPPVLTAQGKAIALSMVRRHRLIETFLVESLGYGWDEVHDEAETLAHAASDLLIDRIDAFPGCPRPDPPAGPARGRSRRRCRAPAQTRGEAALRRGRGPQAGSGQVVTGPIDSSGRVRSWAPFSGTGVRCAAGRGRSPSERRILPRGAGAA